MFNRKSNSIKTRLPKSETVELIGMEVNGKVITNIEANGQIRVISDKKKFDITDEKIEEWKEKHSDVGLKFHEGTLLTEHDSADLYDVLAEDGVIEYG